MFLPTPQPLLTQCTTLRPVECIITLPCGLCSHHLSLPLEYELHEGRDHLSLGSALSPASGTGSGLRQALILLGGRGPGSLQLDFRVTRWEAGQEEGHEVTVVKEAGSPRCGRVYS